MQRLIALAFVMFALPAAAQTVTALTSGGINATWRSAQKPKLAGSTSNIFSLADADERPIQATDYTSVYLCVVPGCTLQALPDVVIAPPDFPLPNQRPLALERKKIAKLASIGGRQLGGTEYNGSLFSRGTRGSVVVSQHSIRTAYDNAQNVGTVQIGVIADAARADGLAARAGTFTTVKDPLRWRLEETTRLDYLTVRIENLHRRVAGAETVGQRRFVGVARAKVQGAFTCDGGGTTSGFTIPFSRVFQPLVGPSDGSVLEETYSDPTDQPTLHLADIDMPAGNCWLDVKVTARAKARPTPATLQELEEDDDDEAAGSSVAPLRMR